MFDPPSSNAYNSITLASVGSPDHIALAEAVARQGMTLLKNSVVGTAPALPVALASLPHKRLAIIGNNAEASYVLLGSYSDPGCCTGGIPTVLEVRACVCGHCWRCWCGWWFRHCVRPA
jgi:hypothetical protein